MKPKPLYARRVAELREFTGMSQVQFAAMLGVSRETIISVENGRNRLSRGLAKRFRFGAGVDDSELLDGRRMLLDMDGNPYSADSFRRWQDQYPELKDGTQKSERDRLALASFDFLKSWIELIFIAATRSGVGGRNRFPNVLKSLEAWMEEVCLECKLGNEIKTVLEEWGHSVKPLTVSVKALRADRRLAKLVRFKDSKRYKDSDTIPAPYDSFYHWRFLVFELKNPRPYKREAAGDHTMYYSFDGHTGSKRRKS